MRTTRSRWLAVLAALLLSRTLWAMGMEDIGDQPLAAPNYTQWDNIMPLLNRPRVYHSWVNGNEQFYYRGKTEALNDALKDFAEVKTAAHEVLIRPGPGLAHNFGGGREIPFNWDVHIHGGISEILTKADKGDKVWSASPVLTIYVGDDIVLNEIKIPQGVTVVELSELAARFREALSSSDKTVRGWACGQLALLDPYDDQSLQAVTVMLKDDDAWVRLNAAGALSIFGANAKSALPALRDALGGADAPLKERIARTIDLIEHSEDKSDAEAIDKSVRKAIHQFRTHKTGET